jgi:hypothetical protein
MNDSRTMHGPWGLLSCGTGVGESLLREVHEDLSVWERNIFGFENGKM